MSVDNTTEIQTESLEDVDRGFKTHLLFTIREAINKIPPSPPGATLAESRKAQCIHNDHILNVFGSAGYSVENVFSEDTGRYPGGEFCPNVMNEHGIAAISLGDGRTVLVDISAAQFAPLNPNLGDKQFIAIVTEDSSKYAVCQQLYGGGEWHSLPWTAKKN